MPIPPELRGRLIQVPPSTPFLGPDRRRRGWKVQVPGSRTRTAPAMAGRRVHVGIDAGSLVCLETGDPANDGRIMGGAGAAHNGRID